MRSLDRDLSQRLVDRMFVHPGDEDFGQCFFNTRRALFRLTHLQPAKPWCYTEGYAVYRSYDAPLPYGRVTGHAWVTNREKIVDVDYVAFGRYDAVYFPGLHLKADEVYQRLEVSRDHTSAFGLLPMGRPMVAAYVAACEYLIETWPDEVTDYDRQHLAEWRHNLSVISENETSESRQA